MADWQHQKLNSEKQRTKHRAHHCYTAYPTLDISDSMNSHQECWRVNMGRIKMPFRACKIGLGRAGLPHALVEADRKGRKATASAGESF